MEKYSPDWTIDDEQVIRHDDGQFYQVIKGPYGNPVIYQETGGAVYLTMVHGKVLCEEETIYEDGRTATTQWRVVRASVSNSDQPNLPGKPIFLGEGHSNPQRIVGPPDRYYLIELDVNPDDNRYRLLSTREVAQGKDSIGKAAVLMWYEFCDC